MITHKKTTVIFSLGAVLLMFLHLTEQIPFWAILVFLVCWLTVIVLGSFQIHSNYHINAFCKNENYTDKKIALTFDDGPSQFTLEILALLKKHNVKATFFCIGKNIEKHPEIIQQINAEGHLIGNHSYSHSHFFDFYTGSKIQKEIQQTDDLIFNLIKKRPLFFRPPYGVTTPSMARALKKTTHTVIGWNIRSLDGAISNENKIYNRIIKRISPGGIVLLHDTSEHSVRVLEQLLQFLQNNHYSVITLEELLNLKAYEN